MVRAFVLSLSSRVHREGGMVTMADFCLVIICVSSVLRAPTLDTSTTEKFQSFYQPRTWRAPRCRSLDQTYKCTYNLQTMTIPNPGCFHGSIHGASCVSLGLGSALFPGRRGLTQITARMWLTNVV
jgi:hypothetical protein